MKTRNIFAALAVGLFAAIAMGTVGCTQSEEGKEIPGKEYHDTIRTTDTIGKFNISKITVEAIGGHKEVEFTPDGDWTFNSSDEWLKVTSDKGTKTDRMLVFEVAENMSAEARVGKTTLTVGGVKYPLTINQKGAVPEIKVFGAVSTFNEYRTEIEIKQIASNVDLEVASVPVWIERAVVDKDETGFWMVTAWLKAGSYDSEVRKGEIVLKGVGLSITASIAVECAATAADMMLETYGNFGYENPFPGLSDNPEDMSRKFTTMHKPSTLDESDPYTVLAYPATMAKYGGQVKSGAAPYENITIVKTPTVNAPGAAYIAQDWQVTLGDYIDTRDQGIALFIMKESEVAGFDPSIGYADINIDQLFGTLAVFTNIAHNFDFTLAVNEAEIIFSTNDAAGDLTVEITGGVQGDKGATFDTRFKGTLTQISKVSPSATKGAGWSDYVYKVISTRAQQDMMGLPTQASYANTFYYIKISAEKIPLTTVSTVKYLYSDNGKLKTEGDKFKLASWNSAGVVSTEVTVMYRTIAKDIMATPAFSTASDGDYYDVTEVSKQTTDDNNDGYLEYVYKITTKKAFDPIVAWPWYNPSIAIYHKDGRYAGTSIPIEFTGWERPKP